MRISHSNVLLSSALLTSVVIAFPHAVYAFRMLDFDPTEKDYAYREMQIRSRATAIEQQDLPRLVADYRQEDNRREDNRREDNRREDNRLIENREFYRREDNRRIQEKEEAEAAAEQQSDNSKKTGAARRLSAPSLRGRSRPDPQAVKRKNEQRDRQVDLIRQQIIRDTKQRDRQLDLEAQRIIRDTEQRDRQIDLEAQRIIRDMKQLEQPIESQNR